DCDPVVQLERLDVVVPRVGGAPAGGDRPDAGAGVLVAGDQPLGGRLGERLGADRIDLVGARPVVLDRVVVPDDDLLALAGLPPGGGDLVDDPVQAVRCDLQALGRVADHAGSVGVIGERRLAGRRPAGQVVAVPVTEPDLPAVAVVDVEVAALGGDDLVQDL